MTPALCGTARLFAVALAAFVAACDSPTETPAPRADRLSPLASQSGLGSAINRDLAALRKTTAAFHDFDAASLRAGRSRSPAA